jgi:hypothetical protein
VAELDPVGGTSRTGALVGSSAAPFLFNHQATRFACCCGGCGHVGNAAALSKRSVMSTAVSLSAPVMSARQTAIGVRFASLKTGKRFDPTIAMAA